jgi:hypothetical protein
VLKTIAPAMHVLEAFKAEVVFAICTEDLGPLDGACRTETSASSSKRRVVLPGALTAFVQGIEARLTLGHETLVAFEGRLHHAARLAWNLQIAKVLMEEHVRLREKETIH